MRRLEVLRPGLSRYFLFNLYVPRGFSSTLSSTYSQPPPRSKRAAARVNTAHVCTTQLSDDDTRRRDDPGTVGFFFLRNSRKRRLGLLEKQRGKWMRDVKTFLHHKVRNKDAVLSRMLYNSHHLLVHNPAAHIATVRDGSHPSNGHARKRLSKSRSPRGRSAAPACRSRAPRGATCPTARRTASDTKTAAGLA